MENRINALDSKPLINEVGEVIRKGINDLLEKFTERYNILEDTHNKIMILPSVQYHLNGGKSGECFQVNNSSTNMNDVTTYISNLIESKLLQDNIKLQEKIDSFDHKINEYNDKYDKLTNLVLELSENSNKLTKLVVELSENSNQNRNTLNEHINTNINNENNIIEESDDLSTDDLSTDDKSLISECELNTENIKIVINDDNEENSTKNINEISAEELEEEEEEEDEGDDEEEDEDEEEVFSITINGKSYFTNDEKNGDIYEDIDDDIGDKVGIFKKSKPVFF